MLAKLKNNFPQIRQNIKTRLSSGDFCVLSKKKPVFKLKPAFLLSNLFK